MTSVTSNDLADLVFGWLGGFTFCITTIISILPQAAYSLEEGHLPSIIEKN